jgi:uncharacterized protein YdeI (YjbR/CyaY-like superfamily)
VSPTFFASATEFYDWLFLNHVTESEILVGFHKRHTDRSSLTWSEAVDQALCFGWIDGVRRSLGEEAYTIRFTPRTAKSGWSKINTENAEQLIASGRMQAAGLAEIEKAKADGRWHSAYDSPKTKALLPDLEAALAANPKAKAFYETLNRQNTYAIQYRLQTAKKPETRAKRLQTFIEMLERGEMLHPT